MAQPLKRTYGFDTGTYGGQRETEPTKRPARQLSITTAGYHPPKVLGPSIEFRQRERTRELEERARETRERREATRFVHPVAEEPPRRRPHWDIPKEEQRRMAEIRQPTPTAPRRDEYPRREEYPKFTPPGWSEKEIRKLTQKYAAAPTRRLRETIRRIAGQEYGAPMVKRMTLREALEGYGTALESVMAGAGRAAVGEYGERYGREYEAARMQWQTDIEELERQFEDTYKRWETGEPTGGAAGAPG